MGKPLYLQLPYLDYQQWIAVTKFANDILNVSSETNEVLAQFTWQQSINLRIP